MDHSRGGPNPTQAPSSGNFDHPVQQPQSLQDQLQKKQIEAKLYILKPQSQKTQGNTQNKKSTHDSDAKHKLLKAHIRGTAVVNQQSSGDTDAMNGVGSEDMAVEDGGGLGSPIESEKWNFKTAGGSKGIFQGPNTKNIINVDFTDTQAREDNIQLRIVAEQNQGEAPQQQKMMIQNLGSSIDSTPNNDQNDLYQQQQRSSEKINPQLQIGYLSQEQVHIAQSELISAQQNQHKTIVQLNYNPKNEGISQSKNQSSQNPEILAHALVAPQQMSQNAQRLHQYSKLIHKSSIAGTKFAILNSQLKLIHEQTSAPSTFGTHQESKPQLLSNKKAVGITSSLITKSSVISTSSTGLRKSHASPNHNSHISNNFYHKQTKTTIKNHGNDSEYQMVSTTPFVYQGQSSVGTTQSFHQNNNKLSQFSITPGQALHKSSFQANNKPNTNPSMVGGGKLSPRMPQTSSGSYSILARQRSQNKLQPSASTPQMMLMQPKIINSNLNEQNFGQMFSDDQSLRSGQSQAQSSANYLQIEQEWNDNIQPLLDQWNITLQSKHAYTKLEVSNLISLIDRDVVRAIRQKFQQEHSRSAQFQAQTQILETQLQQQLNQQKAINESIMQVREQFSQHEQILKKMEECRTELKQMMLNSLMCLDFYRDLEGYIGEQRYKKENQEVIHTLNEIEGIMQQHSLYSIEFDTERIQNLAESIQEYIRAREIDKRIINVNIGDEFDERKYTSNTSGDNFIFSPTGQYAPSFPSVDDSMNKGSLQVKITRVSNHQPSKIQQAKLINLSQDKDPNNRSSSNQNRHLNGGCCSHSKDFTVPLKQTTALDELKVKTAMINRLREQLEHKLKKILLLKEELRAEREDTLKTASIKKIQESLVKMEHDYNASVVRNNKITLENRELKTLNEEMQKESGKLKNYLKESNKLNQELKKVLEEKGGFNELQETVAQLSCILVTKRNEVLSSEQRDQIRYIFGTSLAMQKLKHKIHQQEEVSNKMSSYLLQSLRLNFQYKDQLSFLWPLLRIAYNTPNIEGIKLKFEQIWKSAETMEAYYYRELETRANYLRDLKQQIGKDKLMMLGHAGGNPFSYNLANEILDSVRTSKQKVMIDQDGGESNIWQGFKNLKKEYANNQATADKSKRSKEDQSKAEFNFSLDNKLLNTQGSLNNKKKSVFLLEENLNQQYQEDSFLLNDDLDTLNNLLSPFADDKIHKKFEFSEVGSSEPIRQNAEVMPVTHPYEQQRCQQNKLKGIPITNFNPNPENTATTPSMTPEILINQEFADFTSYLHDGSKHLIQTSDDLKTFSAMQGIASLEEVASIQFKQVGVKQAPKTSKKILKEKMKALKQKNNDLLKALRDVQHRVKYLEEKAQANERSLNSDNIGEGNREEYHIGLMEPMVFKDLESTRKTSTQQQDNVRELIYDDRSQTKGLDIKQEDDRQQLGYRPEIASRGVPEIDSQKYDFDRLDLINMISLQAEALENTILQHKRCMIVNE